MKWSVGRLLTAVVLAAWAALFWFLLLSGRSNLYLSPRTAWVVPVGAILLTIAAIGRAASGRVRSPAPPSAKEIWGLGVIVLPVAVVLALPPTSLGTYAASKRSSFASAGVVASAEDVSTGELTLVDIVGALRSAEASEALAERAGEVVSFVGFVARDKGMPADEFMLTRFVISCCVADALSVQVRVVGAPPGEFENDDWVRVSGRFYPLGEQSVVQTEEIQRIPRPNHPYLNP
jgi:putative membrane protein